jgi:MoaD family protein
MVVQVKILFHAMFKEAAGTREITEEFSDNATVGEMLDKLVRKYGKDFKTIVDSKTGQVNADTLVMLNGLSVRKLNTPLRSNDLIMISVPVGGG